MYLWYFSLSYGEAFTVMRRHRINLNLIHDHNPKVSITFLWLNETKLVVQVSCTQDRGRGTGHVSEHFWFSLFVYLFIIKYLLKFCLSQLFLENLDKFVSHVESVNFINLFLTDLKYVVFWISISNLKVSKSLRSGVFNFLIFFSLAERKTWLPRCILIIILNQNRRTCLFNMFSTLSTLTSICIFSILASGTHVLTSTVVWPLCWLPW